MVPRGGRRLASAWVLAMILLVALPAVSVGSGRAPTGTAPRSGATPAASTALPVPGVAGWYQIQVTGPAPANRTGAQMAYDSSDGYVLLFGGCPSYLLYGGCGSRSLGDTWTFSHGNWTELHPTVAPSNRSGAGMVDDPAIGGVLLFGGDGPNGTRNDTWEFSGGSWTLLTPANHPPSTAFAGMAYDALDQEAVLFGAGGSSATGSQQTWTYAAGNWHNVTTATAPPSVIGPFLAPSPQAGQLLFEGGVSSMFFPTYYSETWSFNGSTNSWSNRTASAGSSNPGARLADTGVFDPALNETFLIGGGHGVSIATDLWGMNASGTWSSISGAQEPPGAFYDTAVSWDGADGYAIAFSRVNLGSFYGITEISNVVNQTWALTTQVQPAIQPFGHTINVAGSLSFSGHATGGVPPYSYNWSVTGGVFNDSPSFTHAFSTVGQYNVTLTVTDSLGQTRTATSNFTVAANSTTGPPPPLGVTHLSGGAFPLLDLLLLLGAGVVVAAVIGVLLLRRRSGRAPPVGEGSGPGDFPPEPSGEVEGGEPSAPPPEPMDPSVAEEGPAPPG